MVMGAFDQEQAKPSMKTIIKKDLKQKVEKQKKVIDDENKVPIQEEFQQKIIDKAKDRKKSRIEMRNAIRKKINVELVQELAATYKAKKLSKKNKT